MLHITKKLNRRLPNFPLPIYKSIKIANSVSETGDKFSIFAGLDKKKVKELKKLSLDKSDVDLQKNTSDLARFGKGSYEKWYKKNRTPFALVHNATDTLAGLIWFGPKQLGLKSLKHLSKKELALEKNSVYRGTWHTISYRSYPGFRGKGLMKDFGIFVMDIYLKKFPDIKLWNSTNKENSAGTRYAESLGFKLNEKLSDKKKNWLVMVKY